MESLVYNFHLIQPIRQLVLFLTKFFCWISTFFRTPLFRLYEIYILNVCSEIWTWKYTLENQKWTRNNFTVNQKRDTVDQKQVHRKKGLYVSEKCKYAANDQHKTPSTSYQKSVSIKHLFKLHIKLVHFWFYP